jgi:HAD superfamily hydrolase (TIGR01509 family)
VGVLVSDVTVICFDVGGTLVDSGPSFAAAVQRLAGRPLLRYEWNHFINLAVGPVERDLKRLGEHLGVDPGEVVQLYEFHSRHPAKLFADALPTLEALASYHCVALSNAPRWLRGGGLGEAAARLSAVFYSHEIGHAKPDTEAFRFVERALGVRGEDILMVGDSLAYDYEGALRAGWRTVLLDREERHGGDKTIVRINGLDALVERDVEIPGGRLPPLATEIVSTVERSEDAVLVRVPAAILGSEYTARPVRVCTRAGACRARLARRQSGEVLLLLGATQCAELGVSTSDREVRLRLEVVAERLQLAPPADLELALLDAGLSWESVPERDRHLAVGLVKEAKTPELRQRRISRIVSGLRGGDP